MFSKNIKIKKTRGRGLHYSWVGVGLRVLFKDAGPLVWRRPIRPGLKSYLLQITIGNLSKHTNITTGGVNIEQVVSFINF